MKHTYEYPHPAVIERGSEKSGRSSRPEEPRTIAEVVDNARQMIAGLAGVDAIAVKLNLRIEY